METPPIIWAVDFDNTLAWTDYPRIIGPRLDIIEKVKKAQKNGIKLILWTCREDKELDDAISFCKAHELIFDAVNENLPERLKIWKNDCRKIGADLYIDDKSILPENI